MTFTVWPFADPCRAFARRPESSEAIRPVLLEVGLCERCPKAIPVARSSIMLRRLPQAALCRSSRPVGFFNVSARTFGRLSWRELFQPAIYYAEEGFPVTEIVQDTWKSATAKLWGDDAARQIF